MIFTSLGELRKKPAKLVREIIGGAFALSWRRHLKRKKVVQNENWLNAKMVSLSFEMNLGLMHITKMLTKLYPT